MDNSNRNTRTLIVSFVVAIFALIPLWFVEVGEMQSFMSDAQVLGETISVPTENNYIEEAKLESPYDSIENCVSKSNIEIEEKKVIETLKEGNLDTQQTAVALEMLRELEIKACK
jgi:hypothetical protein